MTYRSRQEIKRRKQFICDFLTGVAFAAVCVGFYIIGVLT